MFAPLLRTGTSLKANGVSRSTFLHTARTGSKRPMRSSVPPPMRAADLQFIRASHAARRDQKDHLRWLVFLDGGDLRRPCSGRIPSGSRSFVVTALGFELSHRFQVEVTLAARGTHIGSDAGHLPSVPQVNRDSFGLDAL